ncbi:MAG: DNA repair protein RecO [Oscillospiraceae bacterium]|nr:DNA repair protein RecO [Oscillospiraceae bacterium]
MNTTIDGIVLRARALEGDRLLHILTAELGLITAYANRTGTMRSKMAASTEALSYSRFVLFTHRGRVSVDKADSNQIFFGVRADFAKLCLASYFAQLAGELLTAGESADEPLRLLLNCLHILEESKREPAQLKPIFELRLLTLAGFMPDLVGCRFCAEYNGEDMIFFPREGELSCGPCLQEEGVPKSGGVSVSAGVLAAMRHIIYAPAERLFSFTLGDDGLRALSWISEQYLLTRAERSFPALEMYKSAIVN